MASKTSTAQAHRNSKGLDGSPEALRATYNRSRVVVIGAGIGGLTTAAILARAGLAVTVLEAHVYPGGCAGTFYHQGYHFDAGATLAGGFYPGGFRQLSAAA